MPYDDQIIFAFAAFAALGLAPLRAAGTGHGNSSNYNQPLRHAAGPGKQPVNASLRDANGNLTVVNGLFTSSSFSQQSGVQQAGIDRFRRVRIGRGLRRARHDGVGISSGGSTSIGGFRPPRHRQFAQRRDHRQQQHRRRQLQPDQQRQSDRHRQSLNGNKTQEEGKPHPMTPRGRKFLVKPVRPSGLGAVALRAASARSADCDGPLHGARSAARR